MTGVEQNTRLLRRLRVHRGRAQTHGIEVHIKAMKSYVNAAAAMQRPGSRRTRSGSGPESGRAGRGSSPTVPYGDRSQTAVA